MIFAFNPKKRREYDLVVGSIKYYEEKAIDNYIDVVEWDAVLETLYEDEREELKRLKEKEEELLDEWQKSKTNKYNNQM